MTKNHDDFLLTQITRQLVENKFEQGVANSAAMAAVDHKRSNPNVKVAELITWAKSYAKTYQRIKDKPAVSRQPATAQRRHF